MGALLLGMIIGGASAGTADPRDSADYKTVVQDLDQTREELDSSEDELASAEADLEDIAGDLPAREEAVAQTEIALKECEEAVAKSESEVRKASAAVARREKAVGIVEKEIANNTIPGDGVFEVGVDMKPGFYKTSGAAGCYYGVNGDANGNNIKSNNITDGPATVAVAAGEYFETQGCADWILQH